MGGREVFVISVALWGATAGARVPNGEPCAVVEEFAGPLTPAKPRFTLPSDIETLNKLQWRKMFVRSDAEVPLWDGTLFRDVPATPFLHTNYLRNQAEGADYAYRCFLGLETPADHWAMVRRHNLIAAVGTSERSFYLARTGKDVYRSYERYPGKSRLDPSIPHGEAIQGDAFAPSATLQATLERHGFVAPKKDVWKPRLIAIPATHQTNVQKHYDGSFTRFGPDIDAWPVYEAASARLYGRLKEWRDATPAEVREHWQEVSTLLADYYQVSINWMPFVSINNSVFMSQINTMLKHWGFEPMLHGDLDYAALVADSGVFRPLFREAIANAQKR